MSKRSVAISFSKEDILVMSNNEFIEGVSLSSKVSSYILEGKQKSSSGKEIFLVPIEGCPSIEMNQLRGKITFRNLSLDSLEVRGIVSSIFLENVHIRKDVSLETCIGDISMSACNIGGNLLVDSSLGNYLGTKVNASKMDLRLKNGNIQLLSGTTDQLCSKTEYGNVTFKGLQLKERLDSKIYRGNFQLKQFKYSPLSILTNANIEIGSGTCFLPGSAPENIWIHGTCLNVVLNPALFNNSSVEIERVFGKTIYKN